MTKCQKSHQYNLLSRHQNHFSKLAVVTILMIGLAGCSQKQMDYGRSLWDKDMGRFLKSGYGNINKESMCNGPLLDPKGPACTQQEAITTLPVTQPEPAVTTEVIEDQMPEADHSLPDAQTSSDGKDTDVVPNFKPLEDETTEEVTPVSEVMNTQSQQPANEELAPIEIKPEAQPETKTPEIEMKELPPQSQKNDLQIAPTITWEDGAEKSSLLLPEPPKTEEPTNVITLESITWSEAPIIAEANTQIVPPVSSELYPNDKAVPDAYQTPAQPLPTLQSKSVATDETSLSWQEIGDYKTSPFADAFRAAGSAPKEGNAPQAQNSTVVSSADPSGIEKSKSVTIFPIN